MRRCSTLIEFITLKMIEYGQLMVELLMLKVILGKNESFRESLWFGSKFILKVYPVLVIFEAGTVMVLSLLIVSLVLIIKIAT